MFSISHITEHWAFIHSFIHFFHSQEVDIKSSTPRNTAVMEQRYAADWLRATESQTLIQSLLLTGGGAHTDGLATTQTKGKREKTSRVQAWLMCLVQTLYFQARLPADAIILRSIFKKQENT